MRSTTRTVTFESAVAARGALCLALLLVTAGPVRAVGHRHADPGGFSLELLVDGTPVREYLSRGTTYVEALPGREYAIRLGNHTPARVAVALSVDGLNSIDAQSTTAAAASKWILEPWQTITIEGWQTGPSSARRFFFTTEQRSYGAWLGETRNLGIISAAVFRERRPEPAPIVREEAAPGAPAAGERRSGPEAQGAAGRERKDAASSIRDDLAATGIGEEVGHRVTRVAFDAEPAPAAVMNIRYEYHDALVRLGVLEKPGPCGDPMMRRETAEGFEGMRFAPDPYRRRCP